MQHNFGRTKVRTMQLKKEEKGLEHNNNKNKAGKDINNKLIRTTQGRHEWRNC